MALDIIGSVLTLVAVALGAWFLGLYMVKVFAGERVFMSRVMRPVERVFYKASGIDEEKEQSWKGYLVAVLLVSIVSLVFTYVILRIQNHLPLNPAGQSSVPGDLSFNTALSFTTNTNWQNYAGESTMSYTSQMLALVLHQFLSAATGIAIAVALVRALARRSGKTIGNFYVDVVRGVLYVLLPISVDLVTGDFTGFDPDITEAGALAQVDMVAKARSLDPAKVRQAVESHLDGRVLGVFGEPHVNVLSLNKALDESPSGR